MLHANGSKKYIQNFEGKAVVKRPLRTLRIDEIIILKRKFN
jgi:hypothetical protein